MRAITNFSGPYEFLSNFYPSPIDWRGFVWPTVEHAFQASKSNNPQDWRRMADILFPGRAKKEGRQLPLRADWEEVKDDIMLELLRLKFSIPHLRPRLLKTGTAHLEETNWWGDTYWGICQGRGQNRLGELLMQVRDELRDRQGHVCQASLEASTEDRY